VLEKPFLTITKFNGRNNVDAAENIGPYYFQDDTNVDLDDYGKPSRRDGRTLWKSGTGPGCYKWLFGVGYGTLAVKTTQLVLIFPNKSEVVLRSDLLLNRRMVYQKVLNRAYYTNGQVIGYVENGTDNSLSASGNFKDVLPAGDFLAYYRSRLWVGVGSRLYMSDFGKFDQYDTRYFGKGFAAQLTMVGAVNDGLYVATDRTFFVAMTDPMNFQEQKVPELVPYGAKPHQIAALDGGLITKDKTYAGRVLLWNSPQGICLGTDGGQFENLTGQYYIPPDGGDGTAFFRKNANNTNQVIFTISQ
jgi:hypothetical protein